MSKIFISYARDTSCGEALANEIQNELEAADFTVFRDVTGLKGGDYWLQRLEQELRESELVVLVLSEKVLRSKWVRREIILAEKLNIPIIPIFAELIDLPLWLVDLQVLDFSVQNNWQELSSAIASHIDISSVFKSSTSIPSWARHSGNDKYGQYADLEINNITQRFRLIEPGIFQMGSPVSEKEREFLGSKETLHQVTISQAFWLADTVCTQALWQAVMDNNPSHFTTNVNNPVENVSWDDTQEFLQVLAQIKPGLSFQLPTEAQWEYACRAGTQTPFSFGDSITLEQVNYNGKYSYADGSQSEYREETVPVKLLPVNPWGLYEMHGNIWEWCKDAYREDLGTQASADPDHQQESAGLRILRGGAWNGYSCYCRSAYRLMDAPDVRYHLVGFRLALVN